MKRTSIVIISYNTLEYTKLCIESIRRLTPAGSYELIVVDNASRDGSVQWLRQQQDIRLIENQVNKGFPAGCNQGMAVAEAGNDLLLLNSDTVVTPRWLENMQKALQSAENIGAVSCVTNCCSNMQQIAAEYGSLEEMLLFADKHNISNPAKWERRPKLVGFCYLIKNAAFCRVGFLDEQFTPGNYEDDDYSLRMTLAGYQLVLCRDTFIHHYGSASFKVAVSDEEKTAREQYFFDLNVENQKKLLEKWQITEKYISWDRVTDEVQEPADTEARILVVGCHAGMDLFYLQGKFPRARLTGIAENIREAALAGRSFEVYHCRDVEQDIFQCLWGEYDYILLCEKQSYYRDFDGYIEKLLPYLSPRGSIHVSD